MFFFNCLIKTKDRKWQQEILRRKTKRRNSITKLFIATAVVLGAAGNIFAQGSRTKTVPGLTGSWQSYEICDNSVSAAFPALPTEQVRSTEIAGSNMTTKVNTSSSGSSVYLVSCFDGLPFSAESLSAAEKKAFFTRAMQNYTQLVSVMMKTNGVAGRVRLLPVRETIFGGLAGFEQNFSIGTSQGKAKIALYGNRGVWSLIMTVGSTPPVKASTAFFSSMEVKQPELAEK